MNISFATLGQEECDKCEEFRLHNPQHRSDSLSDGCDVCQNWNKHIQQATEARAQYRQDTDADSSNESVVFSADLQKVVMLPCFNMFKSVLFARRIIAFNESFVPVGSRQNLNPLAVL